MKTWLVFALLIGGSALILGWLYKPGEAPAAATATPSPTATGGENLKPVTIGNKRYYFDVINHSPEEVNALLNRAGQLASESREKREELEIAMVLHGPDIRIFAKENYSRYKDIVDLAEQLDDADIIDFKACATTAAQRGFNDSAFPAFVELVPYAPDEIKRLTKDGFVKL